MAFFGLSDINFNQESQRTFGPLSALEGTPYKSTALRYPLDVGSADKGHYMVFFVREQRETAFGAETRGGKKFTKEEEESIMDRIRAGNSVANSVSASKIKTSFAGTVNKGLEDLISKGTSSLRQNFGATGGNIANAIDNFVTGPQVSSGQQRTDEVIETSIKNITTKKGVWDATRTTSLTTDSIALYMPDTIAFDSTQSYSDLTPGNEMAAQVVTAGSAISDAYAEGGISGVLNSLVKSGAVQGAAQNLLTKFKGGALGESTVRLGIFALSGKVTNPMMEMIYVSPQFREFQFEFFFYPRSESEAFEVQKIIDRFKFHQAPEIDMLGKNPTGLLVAPSEFDIKFFYAGRQNPNIPSIGTCVLKGVSVNYAPNGWAAYEVPGENDPAVGRTGMPVAIQMSLQFTETTYLTKDDYKSQTIRSESAPVRPGITGVVSTTAKMS